MKARLLIYKMAERFIVAKCNLIVGYNHYKSMADVTSVYAQGLTDDAMLLKAYSIGQNCVLIITESKSKESSSYSFVDTRTGDGLAWEAVDDSDGAIYFTRSICNNAVRLETKTFRGMQYVSMEYEHKNITNIYIHNYKARGASAILIDKYTRLVPTIPPILCDPSCIVDAINYMFYESDDEYNFTFIIDQSGLSGNIHIVRLVTMQDMSTAEYCINVTLIGDSANTILVKPTHVEAMRMACILRPLILSAFNVAD